MRRTAVGKLRKSVEFTGIIYQYYHKWNSYGYAPQSGPVTMGLPFPSTTIGDYLC